MPDYRWGPLYPEHLNSSTCWSVLRGKETRLGSETLGYPAPPTVGSFSMDALYYWGRGSSLLGWGVGAEVWGPAELELLEAEGRPLSEACLFRLPRPSTCSVTEGCGEG